MSRLFNQRIGLIFAAALAAGAGTASAAVWDFQGETVGSPPANGLVYTDIHTNVAVVDSSSIPADPFGGAGNKSLWMQDDTQTNTTFTFGIPSPGYTQGSASVKIYVVDNAEETYKRFDVNFGTGAANTGEGDIGPWLIYDPQVLGGFVAVTSGGVVTFDNPVPSNTVLNLSIQFDTATHTFTGTLNGDPLTSGGGTNTTFAFLNDDLSEVSSVRIVHSASIQGQEGQPTPSSTTFYDNITLVPEPSSAALLGLGALALVRRKRRA